MSSSSIIIAAALAAAALAGAARADAVVRPGPPRMATNATASATNAAAAWHEPVTDAEQRRLAAMRDRATLVSREKIVDADGAAWYVERWRNAYDGRPDVRTNRAFSVVGAAQTTTWARMRAELEAARDEWRTAATNWQGVAAAASNRLAEARSGLEERRAEYQEKYDSGTLVTKAVYKAFLDAIDRVLERMDAKEDGE